MSVPDATATDPVPGYPSEHSDHLPSRTEEIAEKTAWILHNLASYLARPCWWYIDQGIRIISPIRPGKPDQCSTRPLEVAARVFCASLGLPMAPILIGLAAIELIPRTLANMIQPNPFFHLQGNAPEKTEHTDSAFKVFTANLGAVELSRLFTGTAPFKYRIDQIVERILSEDPDVICLQEVNNVDAAQALYEALKERYPNFRVNIGSKVFSQSSGHFIASKYPIGEESFTPFNSGTGLQAMVNKGLFSFALKCNGQTFSRIFAVHLSPSKDDLHPSEQEISRRSSETKMVMENIRATSKKDSDSAIIFLGDTNINWGTDEWKDSPISQEFVDPYNQNREDISLEDSTCCTDEIIEAFHHAKENTWHTAPMIVDYALLHESPKHNAETTLIRLFHSDKDPYDALSDHNGLLMTVSLSDQAED